MNAAPVVAPNAPPEIVSMFATPLVIFDVPDADTLNRELRGIIEYREKNQPSEQRSNVGGWQSSRDMERWGGVPAIKLMAYGRNLANRVTTDVEGNRGQGPHPGYFAVTWGGNMWANINRSGHSNEFHSHASAYWSGVYYVDDGGISANPSLGGELEFMDPRAPLPIMNAPHLRFTGLTATTTERVTPKPGRLVLFPAWLMHQVRPYRGTADRISIAFNLTI